MREKKLGEGFQISLEEIKKIFPEYVDFYLTTQDKFKTHQGKITPLLHAAVSLSQALINEVLIPIPQKDFKKDLNGYLNYLQERFGVEIIDSLVNEYNFKLPKNSSLSTFSNEKS